MRTCSKKPITSSPASHASGSRRQPSQAHAPCGGVSGGPLWAPDGAMLPRGQLRRVLEAPRATTHPKPLHPTLSKTLRSARSADLFPKTHNVEPRLPRERVPSSTKSNPRPVWRCVRGSFVTPRRCDAPQGPAEACFESPPSDHTPQAPASYSFKDSEVRTKCGLVPKNP